MTKNCTSFCLVYLAHGQLSGAVEQLIFDNAANGYTVLRLRPESGRGAQAVNASSLSRDGLITVMGNLLYTAVTRARKLRAHRQSPGDQHRHPQ